MRTRLTLIAGLAASLAACSSDKAPEEEAVTDVAELTSPIAVEAAGGNPAAELASKQIEGDYMRGIVVEISDDRYEGRGPGTAGDEMTREYLVERMKQLDLEPGAADGSWEQPFDLVGVNASQPDSWTFDGHGKSMTLKQWDQFIIGSGVQEDRAEVSDAEVVFRLRYSGPRIRLG